MRSTILASAIFALLPITAVSAPKAGDYLAARQAAIANDFAAGITYFEQALDGDPTNPFLLENAINAAVSIGDFATAGSLASTLIATGTASQIAHIVQSVNTANNNNWDSVSTLLESGQEIGPLIDGLTQAWALVGRGQMSAALQSFDTLSETDGMASYTAYHKALALAYVGDFENAEVLFAQSAETGMSYTRRAAIAHTRVLSNLDRSDDALALLDSVFGKQTDPTLVDIRTALINGEMLPFNHVRSAQDGLSEVYLAVAQVLLRDGNDAYTLRFARAAMALNPDNTDALLISASLLENLGQYDLATAAYAGIADDDPAFQSAELGRSEALRKAGKLDEAIVVLSGLTARYPDMPRVHAAAADLFREADDLAAAKDSYTTALGLYDTADPIKWFIYYARGITNHSLDDWPAAESDFRAALALNKDQPQVLNYLGYSMVERGINLDEALQMIETAVAAEPRNGAIVDSLGWVLFQLGNYDDAVGHLENAASLLPVDPIINDHLGDAFWAVGRFVEAQFQWNRALSFDPLEANATRIRRKLDVGLDAVLVEEGAAPIGAQSDDD